MKYFTSIFILLFCACSTGVKESSQTSGKDSTKADTAISSGIAPSYPTLVLPALDTAIIFPKLRTLQKKYTGIPFLAPTSQGYWLYVRQGKCSDKDIFSGTCLYGIVDLEGTTIVPVDYTKIGGPDALANGLVELESNGMVGLLNIETKKMLAPAYETIFPSSVSNYVAIGLKNGQYYGIRSDFKEEKYANFSGFDGKQGFDFDLKSFPLLYNTENLYYPESGDGAIILPNYLCQLGFPPLFAEIVTNQDAEFGTLDASGKMDEPHQVSDQITAFITQFYESGADARGYEINKNKLVTVSKQQGIIQIADLHEGSGSFRSEFCVNPGTITFLSPRLIQVASRFYPEETWDKYDAMTNFSFYEIDEEGRIQSLSSPRIFDASKYTVLTEAHFQGCFTIYREPDESGNIWASDHLDAEDLDLMRNEIFAEYGLIFKSEKWKSHFSKQAWYKPQFENVDHLLSETDKKNIDFILKMKEKLKVQGDQLINKRIEQFVVAG
ncbi:MAG: YARHG domain-containing protein [Cytophagaceae bacterium]|jgi:hypothetical protein|nr:YARHG domain-containing protein [Cytophagaceae bacterium]